MKNSVPVQDLHILRVEGEQKTEYLISSRIPREENVGHLWLAWWI